MAVVIVGFCAGTMPVGQSGAQSKNIWYMDPTTGENVSIPPESKQAGDVEWQNLSQMPLQGNGYS